MKKLRIQSPLDRLPLHVIQAVKGMLTTGGADGQGQTYAEVKQRLRTEFNIATSVTALSDFFHRHQRPAASHEQTIVCGQQSFTVRISVEIEPKKVTA